MNGDSDSRAALARRFLVLAGLLMASGVAEAAAPTIRLNQPSPTDTRATFDVVGLDADALARLAQANLTAEQWTALFAVYAGKAPSGLHQLPAMLGTHRVVDGVLRFEPRFPLDRGVPYRARFDPSKLPGKAAGEVVTATFELRKPPAVATTVVRHVYPTRDRLPENQLKFYLHFSAPMSRGEAYEHVRLLDADGKLIPSPFLELAEELWDPSGTRFTLFIQPGRIKRGLKPREEAGPVLEEGKRYTLVLDEGWLDAKGNRLKTAYRKSFKAGPPVERPVDPKDWKVTAPSAGSREPLVVRFPDPLDRALLERVLRVTGPDKDVPGSVAVSEEETCWRFTPDKAWRTGTYQLVAETILEDLAGNRIGRPFEVDVFRPAQRNSTTETVKIPFAVGTR